MTYNEKNIFAKIINGEANCAKVMENDYILAFMDVMPQATGHTLVIPKYNTENIYDLPEDYFIPMMDSIRKIAKSMRKVYSPTGIMIMQLNGKEAGQTVFHLHFHLIPRKEGLDYKFHASKMADFEALKKEAEKIRSNIKN